MQSEAGRFAAWGAVFKRWEFVVAREGRRLCRASGFAGCGEMGGNILGILVQRVPKILSSKSPLPVAWCFKHWKKTDFKETRQVNLASWIAASALATDMESEVVGP